MTDPYRIINVSPAASSFKLRRTYRREQKRYKPIPFHDEQLKKLSQSRYDIIADAYQSILAERQEHSTRRNDQSGQLLYETLSEIRELINTDVDLADYKLRHLPVIEQNAEWHYLMSIVLRKRFYYIDGQKMLRRACELDPKNQEYLDTRKELNEKVKNIIKTVFSPHPPPSPAERAAASAADFVAVKVVANVSATHLALADNLTEKQFTKGIKQWILTKY